MKCPKCGIEYSGDACPLCGSAENDAKDLFEAAFQQYTGYANDLSSEFSDDDLFKTPPVPETAPLDRAEPLPKTDPWREIQSETPPVPETAPLDRAEPLPKTDPWWEVQSEAPPVPETAPLDRAEPLPKTDPWRKVQSEAPPVPETAPKKEEEDDSQPPSNVFVRICPRCGRPLTPSRRYCGNCGYDSGARDTRPGIRICPVCGHRSRGLFCGKCGRDLSSEPVRGGTSVPPSARSSTSFSSASPAGTSPHRKWVAVVLCLIFGVLGVHRIYVGKWGTGLLCILCCGFWGIWPLIDLILLLTGNFKDKLGRPLTK